jgi:hypothetical protein
MLYTDKIQEEFEMIVIATPLTQWDTGRTVEIKNIVADYVHFANKGDSRAVVVNIVDSKAEIPDYLLQSGKELCVYAVSNKVTIERKSFFVTKRERPEDYVYKKEQRDFIYALITDAQEATEAANQAAEDLLAAKERGDFNGPKGDPFIIVGEAAGTDIAIDNADKSAFIGMRIFGKTTQDGVPTPEAPTDLVSVENPTLTVNDQTLLIPYTLHGIPVNFGGHYTDASGQRWICDEISLHSAKRIARIKKAVLSADVSWNIGTDIHQTQNTTLFYCTIDKKKGNDNFVCDRFQVRSVVTANNDFRGICGNPDYPLIYVRVDGVLSLNEFREWIAENPITILYEVNEPVETPLSAEEIAAYSKLRTYKESTTVSNDASAYMKIQYVMDAKKYIDSQISAGILAATVE